MSDEHEPEDFEDEALGAEAPGVAKATPEAPGRGHLKAILEALVFVAERPTTAAELARRARSRVAEVRPLLAELTEEYKGRGIELMEVAGGYQFRTAALAAPFVRDAVAQRPVRLSRAQVETLAIVAYRQPVTRPEIDDIRGVDSGATLKVLLERGLLKILGKKEEAGRPLLYGTTTTFLEFFGLASLKDLPTLREFAELSEASKALFDQRGIGTLEVPTEELAKDTESGRAEVEADAAREMEEAEKGAAVGGEGADAAADAGAEAGAALDADTDTDAEDEEDDEDEDEDEDEEDDEDEDDEDDEDDDDEDDDE